jgi:hypothetical protein
MEAHIAKDSVRRLRKPMRSVHDVKQARNAFLFATLVPNFETPYCSPSEQ